MPALQEPATHHAQAPAPPLRDTNAVLRRPPARAPRLRRGAPGAGHPPLFAGRRDGLRVRVRALPLLQDHIGDHGLPRRALPHRAARQAARQGVVSCDGRPPDSKLVPRLEPLGDEVGDAARVPEVLEHREPLHDGGEPGRKELEEHQGGGEDVGLLGAVDAALGGSVARRANDLPGNRGLILLHRMYDKARRLTSLEKRVAGLAGALRNEPDEPKVANFQRVGRRVYENVLGLEVAVDELVRVNVPQPLDELPEKVKLNRDAVFR
ncbi:alpha/beta hydrolase [Babesia caballi]|uniref:Alpha/beta hydrolase n=1 Tax=Babesia caballi TaxID=5871 RepID=A0AAV4LQS6_BABCB|nr:alpha/beta hydrolase [Babesia caballi]